MYCSWTQLDYRNYYILSTISTQNSWLSIVLLKWFLISRLQFSLMASFLSWFYKKKITQNICLISHFLSAKPFLTTAQKMIFAFIVSLAFHFVLSEMLTQNFKLFCHLFGVINTFFMIKTIVLTLEN